MSGFALCSETIEKNFDKTQKLCLFPKFASLRDMPFPFTKMHGTGNEMILFNGINQTLPQGLSQLSKNICDKKTGVGADQVLIIYPSKTADYKMAVYNADGGEVEMCGNGIRCFVKYLKDQGMTAKSELKIETLAGIISAKIIADHPKATKDMLWVEVDMGAPILEPSQIPVKSNLEKVVGLSWSPEKLSPEMPRNFQITALSMGNPHCVIFVDDLDLFPVKKIGPIIENDPFFPRRVNVEFVQVFSRQYVIQRTWERGSGETLACGTGASAVCVAGVLNGRTERKVTVSLKGGELDLFWDEKTGHVFKTGPAVTVFEGEF